MAAPRCGSFGLPSLRHLIGCFRSLLSGFPFSLAPGSGVAVWGLAYRLLSCFYSLRCINLHYFSEDHKRATNQT